MTKKTSAPYGSWESPITVDSVVSKSISLSSPRVGPRSGRAFYRESTGTGRNTIVEITNSGLKSVLPEEYSASNTVYEYGGSPYDVLPDDRIIFSNKGDTVHILDPDTQDVVLLIDRPHLRYSNFDANSASPWVLAVEEDHAHDTPREIRNYIVAINTETKDVRRILDAADFYYTPSFSCDGTKLAWLEWNHPDLPFDAAKLYWATWNSNGSISDIRMIAGADREGVAEPRWGPDGSLYFGKEVDDYRRLFRTLPGEQTPQQVPMEGLDEAEFGTLRWSQGSRTYAPLSGRHLIAAPLVLGVSKMILVDLGNGTWQEICDSKILAEVSADSMVRLNDTTVLVIGGGTSSLPALYRLDFQQPGQIEKIRDSTEDSIDDSIFSLPKAIRFRSQGGPAREIHGFLWLPNNPRFVAPEGDLPPLIIMVHGGPTACAGPGLKVRTQYFTSRGYAYLALNHGGSLGYGKTYREALFGTWGVLDIDDAAEAIGHLVSTKQIKAGGAGITGVSAGGYSTLNALARHPKAFAGGVCISGVSDVKRLVESIHKLESDYIQPLVLPAGTKEGDEERIYRERSPLYHVESIESPLLLLHGTKDMVTPIDQAEGMVDAIRKQGGDVKMIVAEDEAHGFSRPHNVRTWLIEEEKWWQKTLL